MRGLIGLPEQTDSEPNRCTCTNGAEATQQRLLWNALPPPTCHVFHLSKQPCPVPAEAAPADSVCDNGQTGVQDPDTDVCCPLECGTACGGEGCGTIPGVDASQCCAAAIMASGVTCDGTTTPCVQTSVAANDTTCSNGLAGIESGEVCCDAACGVCGGATCGNLPGLTGADCCIGEIETAAELCSVKGSAPCVVDPPGEFVANVVSPNGPLF